MIPAGAAGREGQRTRGLRALAEVPGSPSPRTLPRGRRLALQGGRRLGRLNRAAGAAALITAVLIPVQIAVFIAYPYPDTVAGWFGLLQDNPLAGLVDLDLLLVVDNILLVVIDLAVYVALRRASPSLTTMATGLWLLAIVLIIAANPAVEMLALSDQFGYYLPTVGLAISAFSGVVLWVWYLLITRRFLRLGR
jgi:hypothetical protein